MEPSVEQKIQAALQPIVERMTLLQAQNQQFKIEIASLQTAIQAKTTNKPGSKTSGDHTDRFNNTRGPKKPTEHHQVKPQSRTGSRPGPKKQEAKVEQETQKPQNSKVGAGKPANRVPPSPNVNKDNLKGRPSTGFGGRPTTGIANNKSGIHDKKPLKTQVETEKKEQGQEKKSQQTSKQKEAKTSIHGVKSPGPGKKNPVQKPTDKKPISTAANQGSKKNLPSKNESKPMPPPLKGKVKPKEQVEKQQKEEKAEPKVENKVETSEPIPDEIKVESQALNSDQAMMKNVAKDSPYTPDAEEEKKEQKKQDLKPNEMFVQATTETKDQTIEEAKAENEIKPAAKENEQAF